MTTHGSKTAIPNAPSRLAGLLLLLLASSALGADDRSLRAIPDTGSANGGTVVRITLDKPLGSGDVRVRFGDRVVPSVRRIADTTLEVVTPPGTPGQVVVRVLDGFWGLTHALGTFSYVAPGARPTRAEPAIVPVGSSAVRIRVNGEDFAAADRVWVDGVEVPTEFVGPQELEANVPATMLTAAKRLTIQVGTEGPKDVKDSPVTLSVTNPVPLLSVIEAPILAVGEPPPLITLRGRAFRPDSKIQIGGKAIGTVFRSPEELVGTIPTEMLAAPGLLSVNVVTPGPGGGASLSGQITVATSTFPGRFVVFTSNRRQQRDHVFLLDRKTNRLDLLPEANSPSGTDTYPSISADGRYIVFQSDRHHGQYDIFLFDRETRTLDPLAEANHPEAFDGFPAISADGQFIVFESDRLGKPKIFLFDLRKRALSELNQANDAAAEDGLAAISN